MYLWTECFSLGSYDAAYSTTFAPDITSVEVVWSKVESTGNGVESEVS